MTDRNTCGKFWFDYLTQPHVDLTLTIMSNLPILKTYNERIELIVGELRALEAELDFTPTRNKDGHKSREYKNEGTSMCVKKEERAAGFEMYSKSLAYALPASKELALAYAGRSKVLFEHKRYEDCLEDVTRALDADCPDRLRSTLFARMRICRAESKRPQETALQEIRHELLQMLAKRDKTVEKNHNDQNHTAQRTRSASPSKYSDKLLSIKPVVNDDSCEIRDATGIGVRCSKKYGKHIAATRNIKPGEIIATMNAYTTVLLPEDYYRKCSHCTIRIDISLPCDHCVNVVYCSSVCRDKAWEEYHEFECPILGMLIELEISSIFLLYVRLVIKAVKEAGSVDNLRQMVEEIEAVKDERLRGFTDNVLDCTKYPSVHAAAHYQENYELYTIYYGSVVSIFAAYYLATETKIFGERLEANLKIFDTHDSVKFLAILIAKNLESVKAHSNAVHEEQQKLTSLQIFPLTALCNRSCNPNVHIFVHDTKTTVIAILPIKNGEPIFTKFFGLHYALNPKPDRQHCFDSFFTTCSCVACKENWATFEELPPAQNFQAVRPQIQKTIDCIQNAVDQRFEGGNLDLFAQKEDLCRLIELYHEYALPCKNLVVSVDQLQNIFRLLLDLS